MYIIVMKIFALLLFMLCNVCINRGFNFLQQDLSWHSYVEGLKFLAELNLSVARDFFMRSHTLFPNLHSIQLVCAIDNVSVRGNHFDYMYDERITNKKDVLAAYDCIQRGISLSKEGQHTLATEEYIKGIVHNKYEAELWFHLGVSYAFLGQVMEAVQAYQNALHYNPIHIKSFLNMGTIFHELGDLHQAMKAYERVVAIFDSTKALQVEPYVLIDCLRVQANRVLIWYQVGEVSKAISISRAMLSGLPSIDAVHADQPEFRVLAELRDSFLAHILTMQRSVVVWNDTEVLLHRLLNITLSNVAMNKRGPLLPFDTLLYDIPLHQRLAISQITCRQYSAHVNTVRSVYQEDDSLVVGFVTVDIGNHPTGVLLDGLLRLLKLNKANAGQQVTTVVYNIGPISNTSLVRRSIISAADHFYDLPLIDSFLVKLKKLYGSHNLDVIVDMQVHTQGSQMELIAAHPPQVIAINYLVYPATSGCGFMNYLLADNIVSPSEHARQYAERLVMMPPSYQVAYYREYQSHEVGLEASTHLSFTLHSILESKADIRRQLGIPQDAVVLCNFNKLDKIDFVSFQVWMQVMQRVLTSILWLLRPSPVMQDDKSSQHASNMSDYVEVQLRASLAFYGIEQNRLIFANRTSKHAHIYRHLAADLFVDTFTYSAHSTATDALFGGLPLLTISGNAFPNKVGVSLLSGLLQGLESGELEDSQLLLIAHSKREFEDMAVGLLRNRDILSRMQVMLLKHLYTQYGVYGEDSTSLMKDVLYAKHFAVALQAMKEVQILSNSNEKYVSSLFHLHIAS